MLQELRYAVRILKRAPAYALSAIAALALGIGANTAVFSVVHAVLLEPLPYAEPERLVRLYENNHSQGLARGAVSPATLLEPAAASSRRLAHMSVVSRQSAVVSRASSGAEQKKRETRIPPDLLCLLSSAS